MSKRGLWDNIHAKRRRIKNGSGERMRKPGSEGAPTAADLKASQTKKLNETNDAMRRAKLIKRVLKPIHDKAKHIKTKETVEPQSTSSNDPDSRFDGTTSATKIYKKDTPGQ